MRFLQLFIIPSLAAASSVIPRQSNNVTIVSLTAMGDPSVPNACNFSSDTNGEAGSIIFSGFQAAFENDVTKGAERDLACDIMVTLHFPPGCHTVKLNVTYSAGSSLTQGNAHGDLQPSYVISEGLQIQNHDPPPKEFVVSPIVSNITLAQDFPVITGAVRDPSGNVLFEARTRARVIVDSSSIKGFITIQSANFEVLNQSTC